ncbi:MAG: hypothetical protein ACXWXV_04995 [Aeromicrobium sp.]
MMTISEQSGARQKARKFVVIAVALVAVEAMAYVVFAFIELFSISGGANASGIGIGLFLALYGLAQLFACWMLLKWRAWARGPLIFTQLVQLGLAWGLKDWGMRESEALLLALLMAITAAVALVCLVLPTVTRALLDEDAV